MPRSEMAWIHPAHLPDGQCSARRCASWLPRAARGPKAGSADAGSTLLFAGAGARRSKPAGNEDLADVLSGMLAHAVLVTGDDICGWLEGLDLVDRAPPWPEASDDHTFPEVQVSS